LRPITALRVRIRSEGFGAALRGLVYALQPRSYHIYRLTRPLNGEHPGFEVESSLDVLAARRKGVQGLSAEFYRDEANRCKLCFFTCLDGQPAGILWVLDTRYPSRIIDLQQGEVELAFVHVEQQFRRRGVAKALIRKSCRALLDSGVHTIYAVIEEDNAASQGAFQVCGFEKIDTLRRSALLGRPYRTAPVAR
jgi:ribosomal protein S18 acetylase RimI-like enzyme